MSDETQTADTGTETATDAVETDVTAATDTAGEGAVDTGSAEDTGAAEGTEAEGTAEAETKAPVGIDRENWAEVLSRGDEKVKKMLSRFASPEAAIDSLVEKNKMISSKGLKSDAPTDDPEALARWRTDNGIPENAEDYEVALDDGLVIGEMDQPIVDDMLKMAHENNIAPETINKMLNFYFGTQHKMAGDFATMESERSQAAKQELINEWGADYTVETNGIENFMEAQGMGGLMMSRMADGSMVKDSPDMMRKLSALSREMNPGRRLVPGSDNTGKAIADEMKAIEKKMGTTAYTPADRTRYEELTTADEKIKARG